MNLRQTLKSRPASLLFSLRGNVRDKALTMVEKEANPILQWLESQSSKDTVSGEKSTIVPQQTRQTPIQEEHPSVNENDDYAQNNRQWL